MSAKYFQSANFTGIRWTVDSLAGLSIYAIVQLKYSSVMPYMVRKFWNNSKHNRAYCLIIQVFKSYCFFALKQEAEIYWTSSTVMFIVLLLITLHAASVTSTSAEKVQMNYMKFSGKQLSVNGSSEFAPPSVAVACTSARHCGMRCLAHSDCGAAHYEEAEGGTCSMTSSAAGHLTLEEGSTHTAVIIVINAPKGKALPYSQSYIRQIPFHQVHLLESCNTMSSNIHFIMYSFSYVLWSNDVIPPMNV